MYSCSTHLFKARQATCMNATTILAAVHEKEQVQHFWYSHGILESDGLYLHVQSRWYIAFYWHQSGYKQRYDPKTSRWCSLFCIDGHFVNGYTHIYVSCCTQFALWSIHVTIIVQSHWPKSPYFVSTAISRARCTVRLFWNENRTLHKISCNMVYDLLRHSFP